jgi:hypothetical protein
MASDSHLSNFLIKSSPRVKMLYPHRPHAIKKDLPSKQINKSVITGELRMGNYEWGITNGELRMGNG